MANNVHQPVAGGTISRDFGHRLVLLSNALGGLTNLGFVGDMHWIDDDFEFFSVGADVG